MSSKDLRGLTFLDVGCWAGGWCKVALEKGSKRAVGVDLMRSNRMHGIEFFQCDVFSEKFLELESFDIVLCKGVLYHAENPISLIFRLKTKTRQLLCLESAVMIRESDHEPERPLMQLWEPNDTNWWLPNAKCMEQMLEACAFNNVRLIHRKERQPTDGELAKDRAYFLASPVNTTCDRILPRSKKRIAELHTVL